jgi:hypothetical protein
VCKLKVQKVAVLYSLGHGCRVAVYTLFAKVDYFFAESESVSNAMRLRFHDNAYSYKVSLPCGCRRSSLECLLRHSSECGLVKYPLLLHINLNKVLSCRAYYSKA